MSDFFPYVGEDFLHRCLSLILVYCLGNTIAQPYLILAFSYSCLLFYLFYLFIPFMSFIQEFKAFAMRGNVVDLAVGVVIGGAFGKIVTSLVADVIMPVIGVLT